MQSKNPVKRWLNRANSRVSVSTAAFLLAGSALISSLLGLLRERLLLTNFGIGAEVDAYKVAFTVPDFMFMLLVSGALSVTFIPVFTRRLAKNNWDSAWELTNSLLNLLAIVTGVASILIILGANWLVDYVVAPGLDPATKQLAVDMMRLIALNPLLFAISSMMTSVQQAVGRFFFFALAPSIYNLGIIFGIVAIAPSMGITGVAVGVLIGSFVQLFISILGMYGLGYKYKSIINWRHKGFRKVLSLLPARSLDQGVDYFNILVETNLASRLKEGAITAYQTAFTLSMVPISLIGVAVSTAAFPKLSERLAQNRPDLYRKEVASVLRAIVWLVLPTAIIAYFGRGYLVRLLVAEGNPTIASLLGILVVAIIFRSIFHLLTRSFYAEQDTKTPLYISIVAIALNITLAVMLANPNVYGIFGLALAQSITAAFEAFVLIVVLAKRNPGMITADFMDGLVRMISASGLTALVTYISIAYVFPLKANDVGFFALGPKFLINVAISLSFYVYVSWLFKLRESQPVVNKLRQVIFRPVNPV